MAFGNATFSGPTKVYEYGCLAPTVGADLVEQQIRLAHQYRNKLVELELHRRAEWRRIIGEHPQVAALEAQAHGLEQLIETTRSAILTARQKARKAVETDEEDASVRQLRSVLKVVWRDLKDAKKTAQNDPVYKARLHALEDESKKAGREARGACGLYWGTYLVAEQAADKARKAATDPRFQRFDGSGHLAVQLQGGLATGAVFGSNSRIQIAPVPDDTWTHPVRGERKRKSRTCVRIRVGSDGRAPVWAEFPMIMHRPLPEGGIIKWVHLIRRRVGTHYEYRVQFVVQQPDAVSPVAVSRTALGIDIGWRKVDGGLRVAYWVDESGRHDQLILPDEVISQFAKVTDLRSIRDQHFNAIQAALGPWLKDADIPDWLRERTESFAHWRSPGRLASVVLAWRNQRFPGDADMFTVAEAWRKQDKHLYEWEANLRDQVIRRRREIYRVFAATIARSYGFIILEDFDLRQIARYAAPEEGTDGNPNSRYARTMAAVSVLRECIEQACASTGAQVVKVPSPYTTRQCHVCGAVDNFDAASWVVHTCSVCGTIWDQDYNAASNLLRQGTGKQLANV